MADKFIKIQFKADTDALSAGLRKADDEVSGFGDKIGKWGKMAGAAFAAAGAAAVAYGAVLIKDGVQSAIEDEAAQNKLALTLMNVAGATTENIAATEDWISQQGLLYGVTDDELRPAIERMARATGSLTKAQDLVSLAMDISAGTGKSLESVTNALGKAYEGSTGSLAKLGIGMSSAELKAMSFEDVTQTLANTFGGQATAKAETFAGRMDRLKLAFDEGKETVGAFILSGLEPLVTKFVEDIIPTIADVANRLTGEGGLGSAFGKIGEYISKIFGPILEGLRSYFAKVSQAFIDNKDELEPLFTLMKAVGAFVVDKLAPFLGTVLGKAFSALGTIISGVIDTFAFFVDKANDAYNAVKKLVDFIKGAGSAIGGFFSGASFAAPSTPVPTVPNTPRFVEAGYMGQTNITVNGAIDAEGTARTIYNVLRDSASRSGNYNTLGLAPLGLVDA